MIVTAWFAGCTQLQAQTLKAEVDRSKILLGEQIQLRLSVENASNLQNWFELPDSINHIEVVERKKIDTIKIADIVNYQQIITLTSFDSGAWKFPALSIPGVAGSTSPFTIEVLPVDVSHMEDYHEIKDIEEVTPASNWLIITIIAIVTLLALLAIYLWYRKKREIHMPAPVTKGNQTPLEWALTELDKLQKEGLYLHDKVKQHYLQLSHISRMYLSMHLRQSLLHHTTDELMLKIKGIAADNDVKISFLQMLRMAETVKFAKYIPPAEENEKAVQITRNMVKSIASSDEANHSPYQPKAV